jgi:hypothetical protein
MRLIESLYVVDSSGLCLYSSTLIRSKAPEPDLVCGFIVAQFQYFRDAYGEETRKFTLEKKEMLIQTYEADGKTIILAMTYQLGNEREEKFSSVILNKLAKALKPREGLFRDIDKGVPRVLQGGIAEIVDDVMKGTACLYLVKGFMGITDHCDKVDAPTGGRPCDFNYATKQCEFYSSRVD